ncbi:MAG TPA: DUF523 domain-containing protein [candidate division Zixibacteria bacterium]|nr:DUF523 domain-containing protein [candidate division Zixibacteria bacterium]
MAAKKAKIVVSACLLGENCRYDGTSRENSKAKYLAKEFDLIPVCPETLGGLPTPRPGAEIESGDGIDVLKGKTRVVDMTGHDVTACFIEGAKRTLQIIKENAVHRVILKSKSPSCGVKNIVRNGQKISGSGVTAALLRYEGISLEEFD